MIKNNLEIHYEIKPSFTTRKIKELQQKNQKLKDNWNDLKKYAKEIISTDNELYGTDLLDIMQELEQGSDSNE